MELKDYSIVKHLEKTPTQISVWALLMSSQLHRQALMKALDDTYVPVGTSSDNVAAMINQVIRGHQINFCDKELPFEGRSHNKALHITVICRKRVIDRVLVDDGSGLNICPLSTLRQLSFDLRKLEQNQVNVRAFDGVHRDTLGAVNLVIQMGPTKFSAQFKVLDIDTSNNLLLGKPFIHMAGAMPSTLHQMMKLIWKDEELIIHGEGSHSGTQTPIIDGVSREKEVELADIRDAEHGEQLQNWTFTLILIPGSSCDMLGLSTNDVSHKLPINPGLSPVKQKARKFKPELSLKIKEYITKHIESRLVEVMQYPTWLANIVPVAKKDEKIRICVDYIDLNKASPKDNFPLPDIHILIDNCAKHEMQSFLDCNAGYHQILMDEENA
ncbi:uncharacterized protein LOC107027578 [Solanum pennellii]|uniref:Uncharacterized protein LOC107027578 n=1 Tax=Solanum pennellii TaxID=28526 RepID=A0ABM1HE50_SOLPN|nr:uncharacterized protein LOC107027578 [Solanum pennellii]